MNSLNLLSAELFVIFEIMSTARNMESAKFCDAVLLLI